ncbi:MAG: OmpA family protein [Myxococcota bacterium]
MQRWMLASAALFLASCVTQAEYDELGRELAEARRALTDAGAERDRNATYLDKQYDESTDYQQELAGTKRELEALRAELELTAAQRDAKDTELANAMKDQDALAASVQAMKKALAEANDRELEAASRVHEFKKLLARFQSLIDAGKLRVKIVRGRMVLELPTDILFASGSANLSDDGKGALAEVGAVLADFPDRQFQVEGHTDDVPIDTKRFGDNWALAAARALGVRETLEAAGMAPTQLSAASFGQHRPVTANDSEDGKAANRRIEIVIVPDLSGLPGADELDALSRGG